MTRVIESACIDALVPSAGNARRHSKSQIRQIARSIDTFGFIAPVLVDEQGRVLAGHGRLEAARLLKLAQVPVLRVEHLNEAQKRANLLADNRIAQNATWDPRQLALEFQALLELEQVFELSVTGFAMGEIDATLEILSGGDEPDGIDDMVEPDPALAVSGPGDLWLLGPHRLACGDARSEVSYRTLMVDDVADLVFADPPYNVPIDGHVSGKGRNRHREFAMASGEMGEEEFVAFLRAVIAQLVAFSRTGSVHFLCMDWKHIRELLEAGRGLYDSLLSLCVWNKSNGGMGSLYRPKHELVAVFRHGPAPHVNNVQLGRHGRKRSNV
jgi:hypothetical protein